MNSIRKYREQAKLTQVELAAKLGIAPMSLSRYETGNRIPRWTQVKEMSKILNCTPDQLMQNE